MNEKLQLFDLATRRHCGCIRFDPKSGDKHRDKVIDLCKEAIRNQHEFLTRARLDSLKFKRWEVLCADFVDLTDNIIREVADSESDENLEKKRLVWESLGFSFSAIRVD